MKIQSPKLYLHRCIYIYQYPHLAFFFLCLLLSTPRFLLNSPSTLPLYLTPNSVNNNKNVIPATTTATHMLQHVYDTNILLLKCPRDNNNNNNNNVWPISSSLFCISSSVFSSLLQNIYINIKMNLYSKFSFSFVDGAPVLNNIESRVKNYFYTNMPPGNPGVILSRTIAVSGSEFITRAVGK